MKITCEFDAMVEQPTFREFLLLGDIDAALQPMLTVSETRLDAFGDIPERVFFQRGRWLSQSREQKLHRDVILFDAATGPRQSTRSGGGQRIDLSSKYRHRYCGILGIRDSVAIALQSPNLNFTKRLSGTGEFGGYVNFVLIKATNTVGPTWTLTLFERHGQFWRSFGGQY
jgi:hypothetical protein